ncbi:FAD binding domain-containing protein [Thalassobaculum sp.]|uniref:FAD binding domain-containing protein n=1 Tax=Thalassobaculum sp. TaxID=2022740 RepID=UPI0032EE228C
MAVGAYTRPTRLHDALAALRDGPCTVLAGGTDHFPARVTHSPNEAILDITALPELRGIHRTSNGGLAIGACTTWSAVIAANLPTACDGLKAAAREVGGVQIQNRGTVGGNLCNASPAADGVPPLLSLDAEVELTSLDGVRCLPLDGFVLGNRRTARRPDELLTAIRIPPAALDGAGRFLKLGARRYLVISIVMVAGTLTKAADGTVASARLAVGACSAAALRLRELEAALVGRPLAEAAASVDDGHLAGLAPIDDVRADAGYRRDAASVLVRRCLADLAAA